MTEEQEIELTDRLDDAGFDGGDIDDILNIVEDVFKKENA